MTRWAWGSTQRAGYGEQLKNSTAERLPFWRRTERGGIRLACRGARETNRLYDPLGPHIYPAHSVFVRWSAGHQNTFGDTVNGGLAVLPGFPNVVDTYRTPKNLAANWRWLMNPRMLNEFVVGVSRFWFNFANPDPNFRSNP